MAGGADAGAEGDDAAFLASLDHLVADAVAAEAARERSQGRVRQDVDEAGATLLGIALDLAEAEVPVSVRTTVGRLHSGSVAAVGRDFLVLWPGSGSAVFLPVATMALVRTTGAARRPPTGHRPPARDASLAAVLAGLGAARPGVRVVAGGEVLAGDLVAVGADVLSVRLEGVGRPVAHVPLAAISEVTLLDL